MTESLRGNLEIQTLKKLPSAAPSRNIKKYPQAPKNKQWEAVGFYEYLDHRPFGAHGDKSVFILTSLGIDLTDEEIAAIRFHMGPYECNGSYEVTRSVGNAFRKYPLALLLHTADAIASNIYDPQYEKETIWEYLG